MDVCRSRGNRSSVRLSILVCTAVVSLLTFLRLPQKTDWRLIFASEVETTNSTNGEASTFMSLATSLKTSKASYTGKENSTKSTSAEAIRQSTPSFMSDKPNRVRILSCQLGCQLAAKLKLSMLHACNQYMYAKHVLQTGADWIF